jgi:hypothetical protein
MAGTDRPMTALDHLRNVVQFEPCQKPMDDAGDLHPCCDWIDSHAPDCPWVAAKEHVEKQDNPVMAVVGNAENYQKVIDRIDEYLGFRPATDSEIDNRLAAVRSAVDHLELAIDRQSTEHERIAR